jgi:hypothetical protein
MEKAIRTRIFDTIRPLVRPFVSGWLCAEAVHASAGAEQIEWTGQFEAADGFHGPMRYRYSKACPRLLSLQRHPQLLTLLRSVTGRQSIRSTRASYNYYGPGDHIDRHVDLAGCDLTVLIGILGSPSPLMIFPVSQASVPCDPGEIASVGGRIAVPVGQGALVVLDGHTVAHERPVLPADAAGFAVATMCYAL